MENLNETEQFLVDVLYAPIKRYNWYVLELRMTNYSTGVTTVAVRYTINDNIEIHYTKFTLHERMLKSHVNVKKLKSILGENFNVKGK